MGYTAYICAKKDVHLSVTLLINGTSYALGIINHTMNMKGVFWVIRYTLQMKIFSLLSHVVSY